MHAEADDYAQNGSTNAMVKVLIVSRVVIGASLKRRTNAMDMTGLPNGYHSVRNVRFGL